jgi:hypothetical protein
VDIIIPPLSIHIGLLRDQLRPMVVIEEVLSQIDGRLPNSKTCLEKASFPI